MMEWIEIFGNAWNVLHWFAIFWNYGMWPLMFRCLTSLSKLTPNPVGDRFRRRCGWIFPFLDMYMNNITILGNQKPSHSYETPTHPREDDRVVYVCGFFRTCEWSFEDHYRHWGKAVENIALVLKHQIGLLLVRSGRRLILPREIPFQLCECWLANQISWSYSNFTTFSGFT